MGVLGKMFKKDAEQPEDVETPPCPHTALVQRWENPEDMGNAELARYVCDSCGESFSYDEAKSFIEQVSSRFEDVPQ